MENTPTNPFPVFSAPHPGQTTVPMGPPLQTTVQPTSPPPASAPQTTVPQDAYPPGTRFDEEGDAVYVPPPLNQPAQDALQFTPLRGPEPNPHFVPMREAPRPASVPGYGAQPARARMKSQLKENPRLWSDTFELEGFKFYIREVAPEVKAADDDFTNQVIEALQLDTYFETELQRSEELRSKYEDDYKPLTDEDRSQEILRQCLGMITHEGFRLLKEKLPFVVYEGGAAYQKLLTRGEIYDVLLERRYDAMLQDGLVYWEDKTGEIPFSPAAREDLLLQIKRPVYERILSLSRYGANDRLFRRAVDQGLR